jgi:hypothetical protein
MPVESLFPEGGGCIKLAASSGWSRVLGIDTVGGSPYCDFANEGDGMTSRGGPGWRAVTLADVVLNLVREVEVGIVLPGRCPKQDRHRASVECLGAKAADPAR